MTFRQISVSRMVDRFARQVKLHGEMNACGNKWDRIRCYYRATTPEIMEAGPNDWGPDPYAWDFIAGIKLTPIEDRFWVDIRQESVVLYPQYPVGRFFVDFANPAARVAIECDGAAFHQDKARDAARQREIEALGWAVYRLTGGECNQVEREEEDIYGLPVINLTAGRKLLQAICRRKDIHFTGPRPNGAAA